MHQYDDDQLWDVVMDGWFLRTRIIVSACIVLVAAVLGVVTYPG